MTFSYPAEQVRRYDRDRFLTVLFAPPEAREHLFALYAFNIEIAKTGEVAREPLIGHIRLQWWRDTLDKLYGGQDVAHPVARALGEAIAACALDRAAFDRLIDARETDLDRVPPADLGALEAYAEGSATPLLALALQATGAGRPLPAAAFQASRLVGTAWALTGLMRAVPFHGRQHRLYLPQDRLDAEKARVDRLFELKSDPGVSRVVRAVGEKAAARLESARDVIPAISRSCRSPLLLRELARLYLADLRRADWDPIALERMRPRPLLAARLAIQAAIAGG